MKSLSGRVAVVTGPRRRADGRHAVTGGAVVAGARTGDNRAGAFRSACAQFATGVLVVTTSTPEGDFGATVNAFTALTLEPPQVIVCLARTSSTWAAIEEARVFAVNVLASAQVRQAPDSGDDGRSPR